MKFKQYLTEKKWVQKVDTKWSPPEGTFTKGATHIAKILTGASSDLKQAMSRLMFYINRAGEDPNGKKWNKVKELLRKHYET